MSISSSTFQAAALDALDAGLIVLDHEAKVVVWNDWLAVASGLPATAALGKSLVGIFPGIANPRLLSAIDDALRFGTSSLLTHTLHHSIFPLRTGAGRTMIHNVTVRPMNVGPAACLIQISDVTVVAERDRVLRERQNARYDAVVQSAPDSILTLTADGTIQFANPSVATQFGYKDEELVGMESSRLFADPEEWQAIWVELLQKGNLGRPRELEGRRKDQTPTYLEISASCWQSQARIFITAILRDVNERRTAEIALRGLNQELEMRVAERTADRDRMWRLSTDVMVVTRSDGAITAINPAWLVFLGWKEGQVLGHNLREFVVDEDVAALEAALLDLLTSGKSRLFELRVLKQDGASRIIAWSAVAADNLIQGVGRDVTSEREAEETLRQTEGALRQSQKMEAIGQLTGGIAHDFNNLLTGIIGAMDILKRRLAAKRYADLDKFMDAAIASANKAAGLTHRLLAFARRQSLDPHPVDVNDLVSGMTDLLRRSLGEQIQLEAHLGERLWAAVCDANQLENAVLNLAINARDAMSQGGRLTIETTNAIELGEGKLAEGPIKGDFVRITVSDTGSGMPPEVVAKAFDPFFTTKAIGQGTGLGLSMVYGFVKQSNGHIRIESEVGKGTRIQLYFPRFVGELNGASLNGPPEAPLGTGETVLLVEDDSSVRLLIAEVLRELGYSCIEAHDGLAALPILNSETRLDLMITDVGLPGLSGRQLADLSRKQRPELKILFVTGYAANATIRSGFLDHGMDLINKPFTLDDLAVKIRTMIE